MINLFRSLVARCILHVYLKCIGAIASRWLKQWAVIRSQHIFSGTTMKQKQAYLILLLKTGISRSSLKFVNRKKCGYCFVPVHMYVLNGILEVYLLIS